MVALLTCHDKVLPPEVEWPSGASGESAGWARTGRWLTMSHNGYDDGSNRMLSRERVEGENAVRSASVP